MNLIYVQKHKNILFFQERGIQEFFKTSELKGENQMYCEKCNTKVNSSTVSTLILEDDTDCFTENKVMEAEQYSCVLFIFSEICDKTSSRCFGSAAEEV